MKLTKHEQETIFLFNERDPFASVFTYNTGLQKQLRGLCESRLNKYSRRKIMDITDWVFKFRRNGLRWFSPEYCQKLRNGFWRK